MIYSDQVSECDLNGTNRKYKILSGISNTEDADSAGKLELELRWVNCTWKQRNAHRSLLIK